MKVLLLDPEERLDTDQPSDDSQIVLERETDPHRITGQGGDSTIIFAVGEPALLDFVSAGGTGPVLPVDLDAGVPSVPLSRVSEVYSTVTADSYQTVEYPTFDVRHGETRYRGLMDVMAVTAEPARISEYRARKVENDTLIDQVRADGIVVSGPAGTPGYGTSVGSPIVDRDLRGMSVVPVSPFRTSRPQWVVSPPIEIEVARAEVPVTLLVDDTEVGRLPAFEPVCLDWGEPLSVVQVEQSNQTFSRVAQERE